MAQLRSTALMIRSVPCFILWDKYLNGKAQEFPFLVLLYLTKIVLGGLTTADFQCPNDNSKTLFTIDMIELS